MGCQQSNLGQNDFQTFSQDRGLKKKTERKKNMNERLKKPVLENAQIQENIKRISITKSHQDIQFIQKVLTKHFLLFKLSKMERKQLIMAMEAYETEQGQYVFRQKDHASMFFIIKQGEAVIQANNNQKQIKCGDFFGQLAILYSSPRSASVKTTTKCTFWCLSRAIFLQTQKEMVKNNFKISKPYVNKLHIFKYLTEKQKDAISYRMHALKYEENDTIFNVGDSATSFFIILSGVVQIIIPGMPSLKLKSGDCFGQKCLKDGQIRSGTAKCVSMTDILSIGREDLLNCLGQTSQEQILYHNIIKWSLRRSNLFHNLTTIEQERFISKGKLLLKEDNEIISEEGSNEQYLYVCLEGQINQYEIGQIINEMLAVDKDQCLFLSPQTLIKRGKGLIFQISLTNVQRQKIKINKVLASIKKLKSIKQYSSQKDHSFNENSFKDYYYIDMLGEGLMGKVYLVENKNSERFALKCIEKSMIVQNQMQKFIVAQKNILESCNYPLISHLLASSKDNYFVYFLLEYVEGGDFYELLNEIDICSNDTARFYFGCFLLSIEYLHNNMIIYRDLKPENAVVDSNGYLHVIDMGTAKVLSNTSESGLRTFTMIGTPHYMAPEIFQAKGYSFSVDIWSLGIILYEMLCGVLPYGNCSNDSFAIYKEIHNNPIKFPKKYTDQAGRQLILRLLERNPDKREVQNFLDIKNMDYFKNFSWKQIESLNMQSPLRPKIIQKAASSKSSLLSTFMQKEKAKMQLPKPSPVIGWDFIF